MRQIVLTLSHKRACTLTHAAFAPRTFIPAEYSVLLVVVAALSPQGSCLG